ADNPLGQPYGSYPISVTITDPAGNSAVASTSVEVDDVAPTAAVSGPSLGVRTEALAFTLTARDASAVDQQAPFPFRVNWRDGTTQTVTGPSGMSLEHTYTSTGTDSVQVTATDKDGLTGAPTTQTIAVQTTALIGGVLYIGGTAGSDLILATPGVGNGSNSAT